MHQLKIAHKQYSNINLLLINLINMIIQSRTELTYCSFIKQHTLVQLHIYSPCEYNKLFIIFINCSTLFRKIF